MLVALAGRERRETATHRKKGMMTLQQMEQMFAWRQGLDQINEKAAEMLIDYEDRLNIFDTLVLCRFYRDMYTWEELEAALTAVTGQPNTKADLQKVARNILNMTRTFNLREGLTRNDLEKGDMLNHRYFDEPCRRGAIDVVGLTIDKKKFIKMIDEFYEHKGLDKKGNPKAETLKRLGIENEPSHML